MRAALVTLAALLALSCGGQVTEIVLVVDTDIPAATSFLVEATYPGGGTGSASADLTTQPAPRRLVLVHDAGPLGPVALRVEAVDGSGAVVAEVRRVVTFEEGRSLTLAVFLRGACGPTACDGAGTCGNDGDCRPAEVLPCEYEGRSCPGSDAGVMDGGAVDGGSDGGFDASAPDAGDGGACPGLCGVEASSYLPGDVVRAGACDGSPTAVVTASGPSGALSPTGTPPRYTLSAIGEYRFTYEDGSGVCPDVEARVEVVPPKGPATRLMGVLPIRDLAARYGTAFVAGGDGAFGVDLDGWRDLRDPAIAGGDPMVQDLQAVAVVDEVAYFGPLSDEDELYRVQVDAIFSSARVSAIDVGGGNRRVHGLSATRAATSPVAIATGRVTLVEELATVPVARDLAPDYEPTGWIALGTAEHARVGAVWAGSPGVIVNRSIGGVDTTSLYGLGANLTSPPTLGVVRAGVVQDDTLPITLWLCGTTAVQAFEIPDADWSGARDLPAPARNLPVACSDLAIDRDGDIWVAGGSAGLIRFAPDGTRRAVVDGSSGVLPIGTSVDFVATAERGASRQVWFLDAGVRAIYLLWDDRTSP